MFDRRRARVLLAILTLFSLVLITVDERAGDRGPLARLRDGVATVFAPVQDGLASVVQPVGDAFASVGELFRMRSENAQLRARLERLEERRRSVDDVLRENERLRGLLAIRDDLESESDEYELTSAQVIALAPSNFAEWTVTIDRGTRHGVGRDMTVIDGDGLVGRVVQVGPNHARVLLAIDRNFAAAARIASSGEHGILRGGDTDPMGLTLLNPEAPVEVGDEVVTSSYNNATFPDGIPIGVVAAVGETTTSLTRVVEVQPYVDFTQLDTVLVILRAPPPPPDPLPAPGAQTTPTPGATPAPGESPLPSPTGSPVAAGRGSGA